MSHRLHPQVPRDFYKALSVTMRGFRDIKDTEICSACVAKRGFESKLRRLCLFSFSMSGAAKHECFLSQRFPESCLRTGIIFWDTDKKGNTLVYFFFFFTAMSLHIFLHTYAVQHCIDAVLFLFLVTYSILDARVFIFINRGQKLKLCILKFFQLPWGRSHQSTPTWSELIGVNGFKVLQCLQWVTDHFQRKIHSEIPVPCNTCVWKVYFIPAIML